MRTVLVALKSSYEAARLTSVAAAFTGPGVEMEVVHVAEAGADREPAEAVVAGAVDLLRARGFTTRGHVVPPGEGGVAERLATRARATAAEAIVMGSRGLGHVEGLVGHSVSHALLASLHLPVLVLPDDARLPAQGFRRILVAVGTEGDAQAAVAAVRLLRGPVEVLAVHVPRRVAVHAGERPGERFVEIGETSGAVLAAAKKDFKRAGYRIATRTVERDGGVAAAISEVAREWDADLIVLGPRRPHDWEALVAGSTSHGVLRRTDRPALIAARHGRPEPA